MSMEIAGSEIHRIQLIDDDPANREAWAYPVDELDLEHKLVEGPIQNLGMFTTRIKQSGDAVICDHHLKVANYSAFDGAQVVSELSKAGVPAILCTRFEERAEVIRRYRRHIPALLNPKDLNPDSIYQCLADCILEIKGTIKPGRRPWRTLVRIEDVDYEVNQQNPFVEFTLPAWDSSTVIRLLMDDIPGTIRANIKPGYRCHVQSNIGAERQVDLFFEGWESE